MLRYSHLLFAQAIADEKSESCLNAHNPMYCAFGGVPRITVPNNLKTGVSKPHWSEPQINQAYRELAQYYATAIYPLASADLRIRHWRRTQWGCP